MSSQIRVALSIGHQVGHVWWLDCLRQKQAHQKFLLLPFLYITIILMNNSGLEIIQDIFNQCRYVQALLTAAEQKVVPCPAHLTRGAIVNNHFVKKMLYLQAP